MKLLDTFVCRAKKFLFAVLILGTVCSNLIFSAENYNQAKVVKVAYYENEVFQEGAKSGVVKTGYAYEYYRKLSEYTGWKYEYVYGSFQSVFDKFCRGEIDLIAGIAYRPEREQNMFFPDSPMGLTTYHLVKKASNTEISSNPKSLENKTIGLLDSAMKQVMEEWLKKNHVNAKIIAYSSAEVVGNAFNADRVDVILVEGAGSYVRDEVDAFLEVGQSDYYLCVNKNRPDLIKELNEGQYELNSNEPYFVANLRAKYFPKSVSSKAISLEENEWIESHNELRIGYLQNYLPYSDSSGLAVTGLIKDLIPAIIDNLGIEKKITIKYIPFHDSEEMIDALADDNLDLAFPVGGGLYYTETKGIYQSGPVVKSSVNLVYYKTHNPKDPSRFAINKNNVMQENFVKTYYPDAEIILCDSIDDCLELIKKEKNVFTTVNGLRTKTILKNSKYSSLDYRTLDINDERCFGVKIGNEGLLRLVNRGLTNLTNQYILDLAYKYTDNLYKYSFVDFYRNNAAFILTIVVLIILIILHFLSMDIKKKKIYLDSETKKNEELNKTQQELQVQLEKVNTLNLELKHSQDNIEGFITEMIRYASSQDDADEILNHLVTFIGENSQNDRVYIFERNKNGNYDNTYEWCGEGVTAEIDNLQDVPYEGVVEYWYDEFKKSGMIIIDDLEEYKNGHEPLYEIMKPQGIETLVVVPLKSSGIINGFIGMDNPPAEKLQDVSDFLCMVEFVFSMMIRIRNNTNAIAESAVTDQLTGCLNRKALAWAYDGKFIADKSCGIVSIDMNGLKKINDSQGHEAGDKFICRTAEILKDTYGQDKVYRMGGDEFIVVLLGISKEEFENLNNACSLQLGNTASIGVAYENNLEKGFDELLKQSDQNMYQEKDRFYQDLRK